MRINVISPGFLTTVQDLGRRGLQQFGLPVCGVMDAYSAQAANSLVGNDAKEALLEITLQGPTLRMQGESLIALAGGQATLTINGLKMPAWESHLVNDGDEICVGPLTKGARAYLAFAPSLDVPTIMGSKATFLRGTIGGVEGRALKNGDALDLLPTKQSVSLGNYVSRKHQCRLPEETNRIRVMMGPQEDSFPPESLSLFLDGTFTVTAESDRMGYRLQGPTLAHREKADIVSDGIAPGSIQVPGHGQPIIMLADRQSTGGYTKIATVIGADLPLLGQMKPGDQLCFVEVSREDAVRALREQRDTLAKLLCVPEQKRHFQVGVAGKLFKAVAQEMDIER